MKPAALAQKQEADRIGRLLESARLRPIRRAQIGATRAEELIADIRAGRNAR